MRKTVTVYDTATGALLRTFDGPAQWLELQLAAGEAVYDGALALHCTRIDVATGAAVEFEPPAPSADHEWDAARRVHVLTEKGLKKRRAEADILGIERRQARALREFALGKAGARERLQQLDDEIAEKRKDL